MHWTQTPAGRAKLRRLTRGRKYSTPAQRKEMLDKYHQSGLSIGKFAMQNGLRYATFLSWVAKEKKENERSSTSAITHVPARDGHQVIEREPSAEEQNKLTFAVGYVTSWLTIYANSIEVSPRQFTRRVAELLLATSRR